MRQTWISLLICIFLILPPQVYADPAPAFSAPTDSGKLQLSELRGKVVYLDFWATWCPPCRKSFPWFNDMMARYKDQGLVIVAVNMDKDRSDVEKFLIKYPADFIIAYDPNGDIALDYDVKGMPSSYLINRMGDLSLSHMGFHEKDKDGLEAAIVELLRQ